jgi:hypothetical protein
MSGIEGLLVGIATLVRSTVLPSRSARPEFHRPHPRGTKPSALRSGLVEASMNVALSRACNVASDHAAPRCVALRLAPGNRYAEHVWSMQASGIVGRMGFRSTGHHRPNPALNRTRRKQRRPLRACLPARRLGLRSVFRVSDGNAGKSGNGNQGGPAAWRSSLS